MKAISKLLFVVAGLLTTLPTQAQTSSVVKNSDVGEIPLAYELSPSGACTYQVPIDIHPDPDEFQPQLSLGYNSQQGETCLGYGWNVDGLPAITHTAGCIHYDGKATPLSVKEDKLMLDGMRLLPIATNRWQSEQGFIKVSRLTGTTLEAHYPNGNLARFETSAQAPFSYVLTRCKSVKDRTVDYVYTYADNLPYIRKITYAGGEGVHSDSIVFGYKDAPDARTYYVDGKPVRHSKLLDKVESYYRGNLWRRYKLTYRQQDVNHLTRIDCETTNRSLSPLTFEYGDPRSIEYFNTRDIRLSEYFENRVQPDYQNLMLHRGKFSSNSTGDGLISYPSLATYAPGKPGINYYGSLYNADQKLLVYKDLSQTPASPVIFTAGTGFQLLAAADVKGTGADVLVKVNYNLVPDGNSSTLLSEKLTVTVYDEQMNPNMHQDYVYMGTKGVAEFAKSSPRQREFLLGDFNGDGKTELLSISSSRNYTNDAKDEIPSHALLVDLQNRKTLFDGEAFSYTYFQKNYQSMKNPSPDRLIPMDYNGDGKTDICLINSTGVHVYEFTGEGFKKLAFSPGDQSLYAGTFNFDDRELLVADMNGDGNMDLILAPPYSHCREAHKHLGNGICRYACESESYLVETLPDGSKRYRHPYTKEECLVDPATDERSVITEDKGKQWRFILSTGNSEYSAAAPGFKVESRDLFQSFYETAGLNFVLVDIDSDGLPDLLRNVCGQIDLYLNRNGQLSDTPNLRARQFIGNRLSQFVMADVMQPYYWSGNLICVDNGIVHTYGYTRQEGIERMLHAATNSYGLTTGHHYIDIMTVGKSRYEITNTGLPDLTYPHTLMTPHYYVCAWAKQQDGPTKELARLDYKYANAVFHRTGLGFRGFQQIETTDSKNGRTATSTFDPTLQGAEIRKDTPTARVDRKYTLKTNPDKTWMLQLQQETRRDLLNKTETTADYVYNDYGQLTQATTDTERDLYEKTRYTYLNIDDGQTYLLGLPTQQNTQKRRGVVSNEQTSEIAYNDRHLPERKTTSLDDNQVSEELFEYDARQRLVKHQQYAYTSFRGLTETYSYDTAGRLSRETDALGRHTDYQYSPQTGLLQSITDHTGLITRHQYDEWGNLTAILYPDGRSKRTSVAWSSANEPGLYVATTQKTGSPTLKTYYDLLKREVRTVQIRFDGKQLKTDKIYNLNTGLLERESLPTTLGEPTRWNRYFYDRYDRPTSTRHASGKVDSCAYGVLTDTVIQNGITRIRQYDATGMMIKTTDAGGNIEYSYRPDGQPIKTVAPGNVETTFGYDPYGRRVTINDPSAGLRTTTYDNAGNVEKETNAEGEAVERTYDIYGRVTSQTTPDLHTTYTYDNKKNVLLSAVSDNGTAVRYTYDAYGRQKTCREEAPGNKWLQKEYTYTADGLLSSISYSSQEGALATEVPTYRNGYLTEVRLSDNTLVYRRDEENATGRLTKLSAGTMQRNYAFNEWNLPIRRTVARSNGSTITAHSYIFNVGNSNLLSRTDDTRKLTENFGYDPLNRLATYGNHRITYDNNGNILAKTDAGALAYTNTHRPYAATGLDPVESRPVVTGLEVAYTAADRPSTISLGTTRAELTYNANHDRIRMRLTEGNVTRLDRYYLSGNYELDIDNTGTKERLYLGGSYYSAPAVLIKHKGSIKVCYIHRDYLGSILQIVDAQGNVLEENSYDPWGNQRNPVTQAAYSEGKTPQLMLGRGYTGHEHLPLFGLINMNARLYDPLLGRFLSPDPYVQLPDMTQAFNRYSYCMNSPLCYVDEDGEFWWMLAAVFVGGAINVATHWKDISSFSQGLGYFTVGGIAGAVGAVTGGIATTAVGGVAGGALSGIATGAASGFVLGGGNTFLAGGNMKDAFSAAMNGMFIGAATGAVIGGISGGISSYVKGENVWNGRNIAPGRNAFSLKNTPLNSIEHPQTLSLSPEEALSLMQDDPLLNNINKTPMTPYDKGQLGVKEAMREFVEDGGKIHQKEVSVKINYQLPTGEIKTVTNRFDFAGELDGQLHLFEVKNGPAASFTPNQKINLPNIMKYHPSITPIGTNASKVPLLEPFIGRTYDKRYFIVIKHYF